MAYRAIEWQYDALCTTKESLAAVPNEYFFAERSNGLPVIEVLQRQNAAARLCRDCVVRKDCLDSALSDPLTYGIWGGSTRGQRSLIHSGRVTIEQHFMWLDGLWSLPGERRYNPPFDTEPDTPDKTRKIRPAVVVDFVEVSTRASRQKRQMERGNGGGEAA